MSLDLKGRIKLTLTRADTGEVVQEIEKDNLVTNSIPQVLGTLMNVTAGSTKLLNTSYEGVEKTNVSAFYPLNKKYMGGVMLFRNPITADPDNFIPPHWEDNPVTACGNQTLSDTSFLPRGDLITGESGWNNNYTEYKHVWEWGTTKGNGIISTICLTDRTAGAWGTSPDYGNWSQMGYSEEEFFPTQQTKIFSAPTYAGSTNSNSFIGFYKSDLENRQLGTLKMSNPSNADFLWLDEIKNCYICGHCRVEDGNVVLYTYEAPLNISDLDITGAPGTVDRVVNVRKVILCAVGTGTSNWFGNISLGFGIRVVIDQKDMNSIYCIRATSVSGSNSTGEGTTQFGIAKVDLETMTVVWGKKAELFYYFESGIVASGAASSGFNNHHDISTSSSYSNFLACYDGYLYMTPGQTAGGVYGNWRNRFLKVNTENFSEVDERYFKFPAQGGTLYSRVNRTGRICPPDNPDLQYSFLMGDWIMDKYGNIWHGRMTQEQGASSGFTSVGGRTYCKGAIDSTQSVNVMQASATDRRYFSNQVILKKGLLHTIANLDTPVEKTSDFTMKLEYTLTRTR